MILLLALLSVAVHLVAPAHLADDLVISLPDGQVQGTTYVTDNNLTFYGFQGIPYAAPPVGSLRYEAPQPAEPWEGVFDATKDGYTCLSAMNSLNKDIESEDCLNINVYTPSLKPAEKLPVMFWIYGGKFIVGNSLKSHYGPDFLIGDVVFVSFNYRLGPFGFLSTGDTAITGNFGLKDQVLAMKWVQKNIEYFGGDPDKVTIFGQSAGGASTGLQLVSEKSAGLYRAAIVESGSALVQWAIDENPLPYAVSLAEVLSGGHSFSDTQALKEFLQARTAQEIIDAANSLTSVKGERVSLGDDRPTVQAWPVVEAENDDAFLTESPYVLLDSGRFNQVPIIIGICANEALQLLGSLELALITAQGYDTNPRAILPTDLRANSTDLDVVIKTIHNLYLKEGESFTSNLIPMTTYFTDNMFVRAAIKTAELHGKYAPVYLYQFAYYGRGRFPFTLDGAEKATHGEEIPFIFKMEQNVNTTDPSDVLTQNRMVKLWTNFAKYLNPTPEESELLSNVTWPITSPTAFQFLNINHTLEVRSHLRENYPKWSDIYESYGRKPFITY